LEAGNTAGRWDSSGIDRMLRRSKRKLDKLEKTSARYVKALMGEMFGSLSDQFGGNTTINQMRIGHYIGLMSLYHNKPTNNKDIAETLGIPRSTVSRIVADCIERGWVVEQRDPDDRRRKQLFIPASHPLADNFEKEFRRLMNALLAEFAAGKIVPVDPDTEGY
jgi:DNA-binding MarR family transcriptional regulator